MFHLKIAPALMVLVTMLVTAPAQAQSTPLKPFPLAGSSSAASETTSANVKIAVTYQFFIEGETQTVADQTKLADQGRKHLYLMLAKECVVLKETIADNCAIERASVNAQMRKQRRSSNNGIRISASASYRIELKKQ
jgi:hypothetical protein